MSKQNTAPDLTTDQIQTLVLSTLEDLKAQEVTTIDVRGLSPLTDVMVVASGRSTRHVKSMADNLAHAAKSNGHAPLGIEGEREAEWVLVDLNDIIVHLMLPRIRAFYNLEKLWSASNKRLARGT